MKTFKNGALHQVLTFSLMITLSVLLTACYVYVPAPAPVYYPESQYDRVWEGALRAAEDTGIEITSANRETGAILGRKGATHVDIYVAQQPDGRVRVELSLKGPRPQDPHLADRFYQNYDRYMGRR